MVSVLFFLLVAVVAHVSAEELGDIKELAGRLQEANINLLENNKGRYTCLLTKENKILARFRNLQINPDYSWLQNDPRVSINLDRCSAHLPAVDAADKEHNVDLIANGKITEAGAAVRLSLKKKVRASDSAHFYSGSYVPFTLGHSYRPEQTDVHVTRRIGVEITCYISFCILGQPVDKTGCLVDVEGAVPSA